MAWPCSGPYGLDGEGEWQASRRGRRWRAVSTALRQNGSAVPRWMIARLQLDVADVPGRCPRDRPRSQPPTPAMAWGCPACSRRDGARRPCRRRERASSRGHRSTGPDTVAPSRPCTSMITALQGRRTPRPATTLRASRCPACCLLESAQEARSWVPAPVSPPGAGPGSGCDPRALGHGTAPLCAPASSAGRRISCTACTNSSRCSSGRRRKSIRKPGVRTYFIPLRRDRPPALPSSRTRCHQGRHHLAETGTCSRERPSTAQPHAAPAP